MADYPEQIVVRVSEEHGRWLDRFARAESEAGPRQGPTRSDQLREDLAVWAAFTRRTEARLAGRFTTAEAALMCDALNGTAMDVAFLTNARTCLAADIEDAIRLEGLADKWSVDGPGLLAKLEALSDLEAYALAGLVRRFWAEPGEDARARAAAIFRTAADR